MQKIKRTFLIGSLLGGLSLSFSLSLSLVTITDASANTNTPSQLLSEAEMQAAAKLRDTTLVNNTGLTILESLTTEVGARPAGSAGDARAVAWAEAKLKSLGFDKVWKEPVTFPTWTRGIETAEIIAPFPQKLIVTALGNSVSTRPEGLQAELIEFASLDGVESGKF